MLYVIFNYHGVMQNAKKTTIFEATEIFNLPLFDLMHKAHETHIHNFDPNKIQACQLLSVKTGGCSEDCSYCAQSKKTKMPLQAIESLDSIIAKAKDAKQSGATRFCMGASGHSPTDHFVQYICKAVQCVKQLGLETCVTMGMLNRNQVAQLKEAGLDYYNHNIDTSQDNYCNIVTTHTFQDRLDTIRLVQEGGIKVCCGGILGLGENNDQRISMLVTLANMDIPPRSVPINRLIRIPGTALENNADVDVFEFVRTIALARILMPQSYVRIAAGRSQMSDVLQAMCFYVGANSIFIGEKLLTTMNGSIEQDKKLFERIGVELSDK